MEVRYISRLSVEYPQRLNRLCDPPGGFYLWGSLPPQDAFTVAVIGARRCSSYGSYVAECLGTALAKEGIPVVSGMAKGIDGICQRAVLNGGGMTLAVLGCGADICYPAENRDLYERLKKEGGILTEYPFGMPPRAGNFPVRNRIISALADVVAVVEGERRSGTTITARIALDLGKDVYAVPGNITSPLSEGCNRLIADGAGVIVSIDQFLEELSVFRERKTREC